MRQLWIIGNWKMYKTAKEAKDFVQTLASHMGREIALQPQVGLALPFTSLASASAHTRGTKLQIGAQNMNDHEEGAFTGEISGKMLKEAGAVFVLLGHSERRKLFYETSAYVNRKVRRALVDGLRPVICVGETEEQREKGQTAEILKLQIEGSFSGLTANHVASCLLAYEPVWAIGTGKTATMEIAQDAHAFCRACIAEKWGKEAAEQLPILYGGSVKVGTMPSMLFAPDIDGGLVGGASLEAATFLQIIKEAKK